MGGNKCSVQTIERPTLRFLPDGVVIAVLHPHWCVLKWILGSDTRELGNDRRGQHRLMSAQNSQHHFLVYPVDQFMHHIQASVLLSN